MEERKPVLVVFNAGGDHSFLGRIDNPKDAEPDPTWAKDDEVAARFDSAVAKNSKVMVFDCFPIGNQQVMGPQGPVTIPVLGTMNWCIYEPVRIWYGFPRWYYFPKDQNERSHQEFQEIYTGIMKDLEKAKSQADGPKLQEAGPGDLRRMEEVARRMGLGTGPDLVSSLKTGKVPRK